MKQRSAVALLPVLVGVAMAVGFIAAPSQPDAERVYPGHRATLAPAPWPTVWPSFLLDIQVAGPPGNVIQPATPTPTPTPTPIPPTPTLVPPAPTNPPEQYVGTAEPVSPADGAPGGPQHVSGSWEAAVCAYGSWSCSEVLNVIYRESGGNPYAVNSSSGACGLFQLLPCPGTDLATQLAGAWAKYVDGGYSFWRHWYQWW